MAGRTPPTARLGLALSRQGRPVPLGALAALLLTAAAFWSVSSQLYYTLVRALGLERGYDGAPLLFTAYYLAWSGLAAAWFRKVLFERLTPARGAREIAALLPLLLAFGAYVVLVLPMLPEVSVQKAPPDPPEFMFASAWYYLPKSADILFQQVLVAALVLSAWKLGLRFAVIAAGMACLFGGYHLLLGLHGFTPLYVGRFTLAATLFGLLVPRLYLREKSGFRWAYGLHWSFYALDATVTHFVLGT